MTHMADKKRIVVGLSGGVDSSVAAYLLRQQGHDVVGVFMKNWHDSSVVISNECPWVEDSIDAMMVAEKLDIPFHTIDFSEPYRKRIVDYMFAEYQQGRTPNPDVLCNREIKFDVFLQAAKELGADYVATGHYCRKDIFTTGSKTRYRLMAGADPDKDQSYFLCQLSQEQLAKALFPIGDLQKSEVRKIAGELKLVTAEKKDSQGLCFIGKVRLPEFLQQQLKPKEGKVLEIAHDLIARHKKSAHITNYFDADAKSMSQEMLESLCNPFQYHENHGHVAGMHQGAHFFTIGQRKGLNIGGHAEPLYVLATDTKNNLVYTGMGHNHPGLLRPGLHVKTEDIHWIRDDLRLDVGQDLYCLARIRYRQPLQEARLIMRESGLFVLFRNEQWSTAAGQFAAFYQDDECIGSGVIAT